MLKKDYLHHKKQFHIFLIFSVCIMSYVSALKLLN